MIEIYPYCAKRAVEITDLFYESVHAIDSRVYTPRQKEAWAPTPPNYEYWRKRLDEKKPFMAVNKGHVVGFMELEDDGHIDCAYTHPKFQGKGVATALYRYLCQEAQKRGIKRLYVEASLLAKPFFEYQGFWVTAKNRVQRQGVFLVNYSMEVYLK